MKKYLFPILASMSFAGAAMAQEEASPGQAAEQVTKDDLVITTKLIDLRIEDITEDHVPLRSKVIPQTLEARNPAAGTLVNTLAKTAFDILRSEEDQPYATIQLGEALPGGADWTKLIGGQRVIATYNKTIESLTGLTDILNIDYEIAYDTNVKHSKSAGSFIRNLRFSPLKVKVDPLYTLKVSSYSTSPVNVGTAANPIARLDVELTFAIDSWVSSLNIAKDRFYFYGDSTEFDVTQGEFQ